MKEDFKSGFAAIIGRPNVGKSTLMNHLIGQKIAITSRKPQTTRNRIQTVYTSERGQIVFLDTPGIHKAKNKLGEYMVNVAQRTFQDADVILWLVEASDYIGAGERHIAQQLKRTKLPVILVMNKVDRVEKKEITRLYRSLPQDPGFRPDRAGFCPAFGKSGYPSGLYFQIPSLRAPVL